MITTYFIACVILILFSAFFSSVEIALMSLNRLRLQKLAERGNKGARMAEKIEERDSEALTAILIGNNVVNIVLSSLFINQERKNPFPFVDKVFTVYDEEHIEKNNIAINCGSKNCFNCGLCYEKNEVQTINEKLK
jgi:hypothetical protein